MFSARTAKAGAGAFHLTKIAARRTMEGRVFQRMNVMSLPAFRAALVAAAFSIFVALPAVAGSGPAPGSLIPHLTKSDFLKTVGKSEVPVLVQFDASWCPYCHKLQPHLDRLRAEQSDKLAIYKVDADEELELMQSYEVKTLPTLLLFDHGHVIGRNNGSMDGDKLEGWIKDLEVKAGSQPAPKKPETESL